jgi:hypothetical protein
MALRRPISKALTVAGVLISACAIAVAPSVKAPAPRAPEVVLVAQTTLITQQLALPQTDLLQAFVTKFLVLPSAGKPFPTPRFPPQVAPTSLGSVVINTYNIVEPWVRWGFDVAAYAVGWIPPAGSATSGTTTTTTSNATTGNPTNATKTTVAGKTKFNRGTTTRGGPRHPFGGRAHINRGDTPGTTGSASAGSTGNDVTGAGSTGSAGHSAGAPEHSAPGGAQ